MPLDGFISYEEEAAKVYEDRRWWLGLTMGDMFDKVSDVYPEKEALVSPGSRYTYSELRHLVDRMAYGLAQQGLRPGDRVLLQLPNLAEFVISYFAIQKAGLIMVLLTVNHTAREINHLISLTKPRAWILPDHYRKTDFVPLVDRVTRENPALRNVIMAGDKVPDACTRFEDLLIDQGDVSEFLQGLRPDPREVCQILPSGGTTGLPKGAPRTHNDYLCNVEYTSRAWQLHPEDTCLTVTTVGHNLALLVCVTGPIFHGAKVVLLDSTYPEDFFRTVQEERVTCTGLVPTLVSRYVHSPELGSWDLSSLNKLYVGAANSPPELVQSVENLMGCRYINAFGMVEGPCAQTRPEDAFHVRANTIGRPVCPYDDFRTLDKEGSPTPPGVEGELAAKGPGIFTGYFQNPQANQEAFTPDGYFRTGDLAVIDEAGNIRITGRIKDIIIRGGENIAAREVEDLISSHPAVEYVAAVGMPDPDLGEQVCAYVKTVSNASVTYQELVDHLKGLEVSSIYVPARVEIVDEIPLTAAGKADKKILKDDITNKIRGENKIN